MAIIEFDDVVDENREIKFSLPADFPAGKIRVTVESAEAAPAAEDVPWEERPWTEDEINALFDFSPVRAEAIVSGGWEDMGITDSQAWVEEQRQEVRHYGH